MPLHLVQSRFDDPRRGEDRSYSEALDNLKLVGGILRLQGSKILRTQVGLSPERAQAALDDTRRRIETAERLHRLLDQGGDAEAINATAFVHETAEITAASLEKVGRARLSLSSPDLPARPFMAPARRVLPMGLIVGELVANAVEFAHPAGVVGEIWVGCARNPKGGFDIVVADDGVGFAEGFEPERTQSVGLSIVRGLARLLGARLDFIQSGLGLSVRLSGLTCRSDDAAAGTARGREGGALAEPAPATRPSEDSTHDNRSCGMVADDR